MGKITTSSTAEYFAKNLQQVGFSSPIKAVLTTLKEAMDNSLDACEDAGIAPEIEVKINKAGRGSSKSNDLVEIVIEDNGPGLNPEDLPRVFGEYLASSKFGRGQCSRGQQGIGISAATTWAQLTNASGVQVISKTKKMRKAVKALIDVDIKANRGIMKKKETMEWDKPHGLRVSFKIDGRVQLNGDGGLLTYLEGTTLVNPHLSLKYNLMENESIDVERVSDDIPKVPPPTLPHPHTMKLGEFLGHAGLYSNITLKNFLLKGFSRVTENTVKEFVKSGLKKSWLSLTVSKISEKDFKTIFQAIQSTEMQNPSTRSVLTVGEIGLSKSIQRLGDIDFFSVVTRKPKICDFKPVVVEVAIARFLDRKSSEEDEPIQLLRFANRVPLQFDKSACAITRAVESINWRSYGLQQPRKSLPQGPYVFAISVTSPFIKFKNASKETIDASDELVDELRKALMQAGQKLSRHIKRENRAADLERKIQHIEKFGPILINGLARLSHAPASRKEKAEKGLEKILGRDTQKAAEKLELAESKLAKLKEQQKERLGTEEADEVLEEANAPLDKAQDVEAEAAKAVAASKKKVSKTKKKTGAKKAATKKKKAGKKKAKAKTARKKAAKKTTKKAAKKTAKKSKKATKKSAKKK